MILLQILLIFVYLRQSLALICHFISPSACTDKLYNLTQQKNSDTDKNNKKIVTSIIYKLNIRHYNTKFIRSCRSIVFFWTVSEYLRKKKVVWVSKSI